MRLSLEKIKEELAEKYKDREILLYDCIGSTNQVVKEKGIEGANEGLVAIAEEQTAGRGRKGRDFFSPAHTGIYMSVLFRPDEKECENIVSITSAAAVAVARAIKKVTDVPVFIKWVNDVYVENRKVCGILTEAVSSGNVVGPDIVVVGIGINFSMPDDGFPDEIKDRAGTVFQGSTAVSRERLAALVLNELWDICLQLSDKQYMEEYRSLSNVIGKEIAFLSGEEWFLGKAESIDDDGGLLVCLSDGERQVLRTGEITLRTIE